MRKSIIAIAILCGIAFLLPASALAQAVYVPPSGTTTYPSSAPSNSAGTANVPAYSKPDGAIIMDILDGLPSGSNVIGGVTESGSWTVGGTFWPYTLGQQVAASSVPVVLPSATISALTPLSTVAVTQSTASNLQATVTPAGGSTFPVSASALPLPAGASLDTSVNGILTTQGSSTTGEKGPLIFAAVTTASPSYSTGLSQPLSLTTAGGLRVDASATTQPVSATALPLPTGAATSAGVTALEIAQGSTTSGQTGILHLGAVSTSPPTYANGQSSALSLTPSGGLRVDASATTQPISGTVTSNAGTGTFNVAASALPLPSGASTAANQTSVQSAAGTPSSTAITIQGNSSGVPVPVSFNSPDLTVGPTSVTGAVTDTTLATAGYYGVGFNVTSAGSGNTIVAEFSTDGGTTWTAAQIYNPNTQALSTSVNTNGQYAVVLTGGTSNVRIRVSTYSSGTVTVTERATIAQTLLDGVQVLGTPAVNWTQIGGTNVVTGGASGLQAIAGPVASGSANADNPVKVGGVYNSTQPTLTAGQIGDEQVSSRGAQIVSTGADTFNVTVNAALPAGTNSVGTVGLNAGTNNIGIVNVNGYSYNHISSNTTTVAKSTAGTLHTITINAAGTTETLTVYDNTSGSGTVIATITPVAGETYTFDANTTTGLTIVSSGTTAGDYTVTWR